MSMVTRDLTEPGYAAGCQYAPPPLHVYDTESEAARWFPLPRPVTGPLAPGPVFVNIPVPAGSLLGDDPTDPAAQTRPRAATAGLIARLNLRAGQQNIGGSGVRR